MFQLYLLLRLKNFGSQAICKQWTTDIFFIPVFWSLSTATSDTQRERAFVKSVYASQHSQSKEEFCLQRVQVIDEFCFQRR